MNSLPVRILRGLWRGLDGLRRFVHLILMLLVLLVFVAALSEQTVMVPDSAALILAPEGRLVEQLAGDPLDRALERRSGGGQTQTLVRDLVDAVDRAAADERIGALYLDLEAMGGSGLTKLGEVAAAVSRYRETGKPVIAYAGSYGQGQYYLAAHADEVYLHPLGAVFLTGFGYYRTYVREALDELSVDWNVYRAGRYKSLAETFTESEMSEADRASTAPVVEALWQSFQDGIAAGRGLDVAAVAGYTNDFASRLEAAGGDTAVLAMEAGLVDDLWSRDQVEERLAEIVGRNGDGRGDRRAYEGIGFEKYLSATRLEEAVDSTSQVAIVPAVGDILPGDQPPGAVGSASLRDVLRGIRRDSDVKAVVLRVDSGGGGTFASDEIRRELELLRQSGTPLVVSMGGTAASGGYMISLPADEIWAHPDTVTGSIGVILMFPTFERALGRLGVKVDGFGTTPLAGQFRLDRSISPEVDRILSATVDSSYERFLALVAESRDLEPSQVSELAGGRIWTGAMAADQGLVDKLGNLDDAVAAAARLADLGDDYEAVWVEKTPSFEELLLLRLLSATPDPWVRAFSGKAPRWPAAISEIGGTLRQLVALTADGAPVSHCLCEIR